MVGNEKVENEYIGLDIGGIQGRGRVSMIDEITDEYVFSKITKISFDGIL